MEKGGIKLEEIVNMYLDQEEAPDALFRRITTLGIRSYRYIYGLFVAWLHIHKRVVKTFDHLSLSGNKLKWLTAFRAVKCAAIIQFAMVMYRHLISLLYLLHVCSL